MSYRSINDANTLNQMREAANLPTAGRVQQRVGSTISKTREEAANSLETVGNELISHSLTSTLGKIDKSLKSMTTGTATQTALQAAKKAIKGKVESALPKPQVGTNNPAFDPSAADAQTGGKDLLDSNDIKSKDASDFIRNQGDDEVNAPSGAPSQQPAANDLEPSDDEDDFKDAEEEPSAEPDAAPDLSSAAEDGAGDLIKTGEQAALKEGESAAEGGLESGLESLTAGSTALDETGVGLAVTAALGVATLISGIFVHKHKESAPPPPPAPVITNSTNYAVQSGEHNSL